MGVMAPPVNPDTALCFCFPFLPCHHPRPLRRPTEHDDTLVTRCLCANTRNDRGRWAPVSPWAAEPYYGSLRLQYTQPKVGTEGRVTVCCREPPFSCLVVERVAVVLTVLGATTRWESQLPFFVFPVFPIVKSTIQRKETDLVCSLD